MKISSIKLSFIYSGNLYLNLKFTSDVQNISQILISDNTCTSFYDVSMTHAMATYRAFLLNSVFWEQHTPPTKANNHSYFCCVTLTRSYPKLVQELDLCREFGIWTEWVKSHILASDLSCKI